MDRRLGASKITTHPHGTPVKTIYHSTCSQKLLQKKAYVATQIKVVGQCKLHSSTSPTSNCCSNTNSRISRSSSTESNSKKHRLQQRQPRHSISNGISKQVVALVSLLMDFLLKALQKPFPAALSLDVLITCYLPSVASGLNMNT